MILYLKMQGLRNPGGGGGYTVARKNEKICPFLDWMCASVPFIFNSVSILHNCI